MKGYWLWFLIRFSYENIFVQASDTALCFLTVKPPRETLEFADQLAQDGIKYGIDVYILIDDKNWTFSSLNFSSHHIKSLTISVEQCLSRDYYRTTNLGQNTSHVVAWDKVLFYFCVLNQNYSFVWFIENDVFIPSVQSFRSIHQLYANSSDLIVPSNQINPLGNTSFWHWPAVPGRFIPPWSSSMVNIVGLSRRLLQAIDDDIQWRGVSALHEYFFLTLAMKLNMTIIKPLEFSTVMHRQQSSWKLLQKQPNNFWHPMKSSYERQTWRKKLAKETLQRKSSIKLSDLQKLPNNDENMTNVETYLRSVLAEFEINKDQLSPNDRYLMRQHFLTLVQRYQKQKNSTSVVLLAQELADQAYKLPESVITLFKEKSSKHLKLEQALRENKQEIFHLLSTKSNLSLLNALRIKAFDLTIELTVEVRREAKAEQDRRVSLFIPMGAIPKGIEQEIYFQVCQDSSHIEKFNGQLLSPIVICGPQGIQFDKPVELILPHSAGNDAQQLSLMLHGTNRNSKTDFQEGNKSLLMNGIHHVTNANVSILIDLF